MKFAYIVVLCILYAAQLASAGAILPTCPEDIENLGNTGACEQFTDEELCSMAISNVGGVGCHWDGEACETTTTSCFNFGVIDCSDKTSIPSCFSGTESDCHTRIANDGSPCVRQYDNGAYTGCIPYPPSLCQAPECDPPCSDNGVCEFSGCSCNTGYTGDGITCTDIDECAASGEYLINGTLADFFPSGTTTVVLSQATPTELNTVVGRWLCEVTNACYWRNEVDNPVSGSGVALSKIHLHPSSGCNANPGGTVLNFEVDPTKTEYVLSFLANGGVWAEHFSPPEPEFQGFNVSITSRAGAADPIARQEFFFASSSFYVQDDVYEEFTIPFSTTLGQTAYKFHFYYGPKHCANIAEASVKSTSGPCSGVCTNTDGGHTCE